MALGSSNELISRRVTKETIRRTAIAIRSTGRCVVNEPVTGLLAKAGGDAQTSLAGHVADSGPLNPPYHPS